MLGLIEVTHRLMVALGFDVVHAQLWRTTRISEIQRNCFVFSLPSFSSLVIRRVRKDK